MRILVDTQALLWFLLDDPRLSRAALEAIADPDNEVWASAASAFEIATKHRIWKLGIDGFEPGALVRVLEQSRISLLPVTFEHAIVAGTLGEEHRDRFDRMLIAHCRAEGVPIVTRDPVRERGFADDLVRLPNAAPASFSGR